MSFKNFIKEYFTFSRQEKRGIFILLTLLLLVVLAPAIYGILQKEEDLCDYTQFKAQIADFETKFKEPEKKDVERFPFNPNKIDSIGLIKLGFSSRQAKTFLNYRRKGGRFFKKEDVNKIYSVTDEMYAELEPYIEINGKKKNEYKTFESEKKQTKKSIERFVFDPNTIGKQGLLKLGFSPKQAQTFLNYRNKGGRFYKKQDVNKIYSISNAFYTELEPYIRIGNKFPNQKTENDKIENKVTETAIERFEFDPNTVDKESLIKLGFSSKQAQTFLNYRNKGGRFFKKEDVNKIYSVSDEMYAELEPYIVINDPNLKLQNPQKKEQEKQTSEKQNTFSQKLDLNKAWAKDFINLGIDSKIAWRIVNFRKALGGYYSFSQLQSVYDITAEQRKTLEDKTEIKTPVFKKININSATLDELKKHPYLRKKALKIINEQQESSFNSVQELVERKIFSATEIKKVKPYLAVE